MNPNALKSVFLACLCLCLTLVMGCATYQPGDVTSHYDVITGLRTDLLDDNLLAAGEDPRELVWLNASRVYENYNDSTYYLEVTYLAREDAGYLDIGPGPSLELTIDGEQLSFNSIGSMNTRKTTREGLLRETAIYKTSKLTMQKIAIANSVKVTIRGNNGVLQREFTEENFEKFKRFATSYAL